MPTTITEPDSPTPIDDFEFTITTDSAGSGDITKYAGWQLFQGATAVTEEEFLPYTGAAEALQPLKDIRSYLFTTFPSLTGTTIIADSNFLKSFVLKYGDVTFDKSDCSYSVDISTSGSTIDVFNARVQPYQRNALGSSFLLFTQRPFVNDTCDDQKDWIWLYAETSQTITVTVYYPMIANVSPVVTTHASGAGARILPVGAGNAFFALTPVSPGEETFYPIRYTIDFPGIGTYTFVIKRNCCSTPQWRELYFQEPTSCLRS